MSEEEGGLLYSEYNSNTYTFCSYTDRDYKGYIGEVYVSKKLRIYGIPFISNPLDSIYNWKQYNGKGVDFKILIYDTELEVKNITGKVFPSWIIRDWLPRFSYHNENKIVAIPSTTKLSDKCLDLLFTYNIHIIYWDSIEYLIPRGNKLLEVSKGNNLDENNNLSKGNDDQAKEDYDYGDYSCDYIYDDQVEEECDYDEEDYDYGYRYKQLTLYHFINVPLNCKLCIRYEHCKLLMEYKFIQSHISNLREKLLKNPRDKFETFKKYKTWSSKRSFIMDKINRCLRKRIYLFRHLKYNTFRID
ncbi:MAG: hypothetical protein QXF82_04640 [Nitrososphaeria archaeon]